MTTRSTSRAGLAALALGALALAGADAAHACDSSSCALVTRNRGGLLPRGAFQVDLSLRVTDNGARRDGGRATDAVLLPKVNVEQRLVVPAIHLAYDGRDRLTQVDLAYGLRRSLTVFASLPVSVRRDHDVGHFGFRQRYETWGLGDLAFGARAATPLRGLVAGVAFEAPTGEYRLGGDYDGGLLDPRFQPGSGSWDVVASATYDGLPSVAGARVSLAGSWQRNGSNPFDYRFGPVALLAATVSRPLAGPLTGSLQAKLFHQGRSRFAGEDVPTTGATFLYLSPGVALRLPAGSALYAYVQALPWRHVNETQLAPSVAFLLGASHTF